MARCAKDAIGLGGEGCRLMGRGCERFGEGRARGREIERWRERCRGCREKRATRRGAQHGGRCRRSVGLRRHAGTVMLSVATATRGQLRCARYREERRDPAEADHDQQHSCVDLPHLSSVTLSRKGGLLIGRAESPLVFRYCRSPCFAPRRWPKLKKANPLQRVPVFSVTAARSDEKMRQPHEKLPSWREWTIASLSWKRQARAVRRARPRRSPAYARPGAGPGTACDWAGTPRRRPPCILPGGQMPKAFDIGSAFG